MRWLLLLVIAGGLVYAGWVWRDHATPTAPLPVTPPRATTVESRQQIKNCRDACEQEYILDKLTDEFLRSCRARCDGDEKKAWEPTHSVSRAPADHSKTIRDR